MNMKLIVLFKKVGFTRVQAQMLDYLLHEKKWPVHARDIENGSDLRQPEANIAIRGFVERGWLEEDKAPRSGISGKPSFQYRFKLSKKEVYKEIENSILNRILDLKKLLSDDLKEMLQEK